jgi:hypothetical protein
MPAVRPRVDASETGQADAMPQLQTAPMGHAVQMGFVYFVETEDGNFEIGF